MLVSEQIDSHTPFEDMQMDLDGVVTVDSNEVGESKR